MAHPHKSVTVDANSSIVSGAAIEVRDQAGALASIYDAAGGALTNPFTSDVDGEFEFYAEAGTYFITSGTAPSDFKETVTLGVPSDFVSVATLIADTSMRYTPDSEYQTPVISGEVITANGYRHLVAPSGATDHHITTGGGVKLYEDAGLRSVWGEFVPDADGVGTPSPALSSIDASQSVTVAQAGRIGVGPAAGLYLNAGDSIRAVDSTEPLLVVLSGQSNAQGSSQDGPDGVYEVTSAVQCWNHTAGAFQIADLENNAYWTTTGNPYGNGNQNLGVSFAHRLHTQTGRPVYVIVAAQGGQSITEWVGSGTSSTIYAGMETVIEAQLTALGKTKIDFFLWHQGEADAGSADGTYRTYLATLIDQLRAEPWFAEDTPFIAGEPCPDWSDTTKRDRMTAEIGTLLDIGDPHVFVAEAAGLTSDGDASGDFVHFGNASVRDLGYNRYWRAMWGQSSDIDVTTAPTATTVFEKSDGIYEDRAYARENYISQKDVVVQKSDGAVTVKALQGSLVLSAEDGNDNVIANGLALRPHADDAADLGTSSRAWANLMLTTSIIQPDISANLGVYIGVPGTGLERFRITDVGNYSRNSQMAMHDIEGDGYNVLNFVGSDGSARAEITSTYSGAGGAVRIGVKTSGGVMQYPIRLDSDGEVRITTAATDFTTTLPPNAVIMPDGGVRSSTTADIVTSIASAPDRTGQIAVVGAVGYLAVGTSSSADWKQITN